MLLFGSSYVYFLKDRYYGLITEKIPYLVNLAAWVAFSLLVLALFLLFGLVARCRKEFKYTRTLFKKWVFNIIELLYFPVLVNIIPFGACTMTTSKAYTLHKCLRKDDSYWYVFWIGQGVAGLGILVGLAYIGFLLYFVTYRKISFKQKNHDDYVLRRELEYVLEINDSWRQQSLFVFSSFKGSKLRMLFKPLYNLMVLVLVVMHAYLGSYVDVKGIVYMAVLFVMIVYTVLFRPFRLSSTNILVIFTFAHLLVTVFFAYMKSIGWRNGIIVQTNFRIVIIAITAFFLFLYALLLLFCLICRSKWPMNVDYVRKTCIGYERILDIMQQAFVTISKIRMKKSDTEYRNIQEAIDSLTEEYNVCFEDAHPFQYSVLEVIDELKDTQRIVYMRERHQEVNFMSEFLALIYGRKTFVF